MYKAGDWVLVHSGGWTYTPHKIERIIGDKLYLILGNYTCAYSENEVHKCPITISRIIQQSLVPNTKKDK